MNLRRSFRGGAFRLSVVFSAACLASGILLFTIFWWQTRAFEMKRVGVYMVNESADISHGSTAEILWAIQARIAHQYHDAYHDMMLVSLFAPDGRRIVGNLDRFPAALPVDARAHEVVLDPAEVAYDRPIIAVARRLPDGSVLVFGRGIGVLWTLRRIVERALLFGAVAAIAPVLAAGIWLSRRDKRRLQRVNQSIERIIQGYVRERLPVREAGDGFDQLACGVNRMLARIEDLLEEIQGVIDNIAHDLRTPLARVRTLLERGRDKSTTRQELVQVADRAIAGLDQAQSIITALLRIGEIEAGQRRAGFGDVDINEIVREAGDLYAPVAEAKQIGLSVRTEAACAVFGDRDLLIEAIANLVDNAIKFTPAGGSVRLLATSRDGDVAVQVADSGPGIPPQERAAVTRRFYRLDKSRHLAGSGLGLSIVLAIAKLHEFDLAIEDARPGCRFELRCHAPSRPSDGAVRTQEQQGRDRPFAAPALDGAGTSGWHAAMPAAGRG